MEQDVYQAEKDIDMVLGMLLGDFLHVWGRNHGSRVASMDSCI